MLGLRTCEDESFVRFFSLVQDKAHEQGCVFFLDCGEGRELRTSKVHGEDLCGWLIPAADVSEFEPSWCLFNDDALDKWSRYLCFAFWSYNGEVLDIEFRSFSHLA
ncbi:MAG: hypothetical protein IJC88_05435 [Oscillospiraceae bacterium]|nr:hypothetical protein [Oscillospiraceae bacterium]